MTDTDVKWHMITGSTGGIGREIAKILARRGHSMIWLNRSEDKANARRAELLNDYPNLNIEVVTADLMDTAQIASATDRINNLPGRIDALYNNSGVLTGEKILSAQGFESHFAVNTLAPYLLIRNLKEKMARPASEPKAMIVNLSSSAINSQKSLDLDSLANPEKVGGLMGAYAQSKLASTALAPALADDLAVHNISIRAIDPGATKTPMTTQGNSGMPKLVQWLAPLLFSPADRQATKIVDGADPGALGGRSGIYVANLKEKKMPAPAADRGTQAKLIALLEQSAQI